MSRDPRVFLEDISTACRKIVRFAGGLERDEAFADEMRFDAILHNFHVIGEAVKNLPAEVREEHSEIPWREIAGMRDFVAHAYFALDLDILWNAIDQEVPTLLERVTAMLVGDDPRPPESRR